METKMQTSFIPKKPIIENQKEGSGISLFFLLSIIVFIVSIALAAVVFLLQKSLILEIDKDKKELAAARDSYEESTINSLIRLDDRIEVSKSLLAKHLAVTPVFTLLEKNIIKNVQLKSMKFSYGGDSKINVTLAGVAKNYDALSKQSDAFGTEQLRGIVSNPVVSDFSLNQDSTVSFNFNALVSSDLVSYGNYLDSFLDTSGNVNNMETGASLVE